MKRKSGAVHKKNKLIKLRDESAALPGQLKISQIFSAKCEENTINGLSTKDDRPCIVDNTDVDAVKTTVPRDTFPTVPILLIVNGTQNAVETTVSRDNSQSEAVSHSLIDGQATLPISLSFDNDNNGNCNAMETENSQSEVLNSEINGHSAGSESFDENYRTNSTCNTEAENDLTEVPLNETDSDPIHPESTSLAMYTHTTTKSSKVAEQIVTSVHPTTKLSSLWLVSNFEFLVLTKKMEGGKMRPFIHCTICRDYESVAKGYSTNGLVPIANGIRVDSQEKLQRVVTHIDGQSHQEAVKAKIQHDLWNLRSEGHTWVKFLNKENRDLTNLLIKLAMDVYNDSLHDTLPAYNWASRSLAQIRADQIIDSMTNDGLDTMLPMFVPSETILRYRNPTMYSEMLGIISQLEIESVQAKINNSICYSTQVDGSLDRSQSDNKFVCCHWIEPDGVLRSAFVGIVQPKQNGAIGLCETVMTTLNTGKLDRQKLVSVTTDGEKANTGRYGGLWRLLEVELNRKILTIWCFCHRSDLALEDLFKSVAELGIWKSNVLACLTFFRTSKCRTKELQEFAKLIGIQNLQFPSHHDIRFAQHLNNVLKAVIRNMPACRKVWSSIVDSCDSTKAQKLEASDLLNLWQPHSLQFKITVLMDDITKIFTSLQMGLQKSNLVLPDVLTLRDAAVRKMEIVMNGTMPGGSEEKALRDDRQKDSTIRSYLPNLSATSNRNRNYDEIRLDIVSNAMELISKRMNIEDERSMKLITNLTTANSCSELVERSTDALKTFFMDDDRFDDETDRLNQERINSLPSDICEQWPIIKDVPTLDTSDVGCKYATRLRQMFVKSKGEFQFLLGAVLVSVPHNMGTERVVSHFNKVESLHRRSQDIETVTQRLVVSINSNGTAHYDPRPAIVRFMSKKERRFRPSDFDVYKNCDFVKKFFRTETSV